MTLIRLVVAVVLAVSLGGAAPAWAHAGLVASSPSPGIGLPQAPGAVVLRFSEPLNYSFSSIEVVGESREPATVGPTLPVGGDARAMRRKLGLLRPGRYTVSWVSVSAVDGHALRGTYSFGIGTAAAGDERVENTPQASEGWLGLLARMISLYGLSLWTGHALLARVAARAGVPPSRLGMLGRLGPALALAGAGGWLAVSALRLGGSFAAAGPLLASSASGRWRAGLLAASGLGVLLPPRLLVYAVPAAAAVLAEAASGHAAAAPIPTLAVLSFALHLAAVGVWVFAVAAAAAAGDRLVDALRALSPYAIGAAGAVAVTGVANAALELSTPRDLIASGYGRALLAKTAVFVLMASFGLTHHLRRRRVSVAPHTVRGPVRKELAAAALAFALATALVGFPNPPREERSSEKITRVDPVLTRLAARDAISVAAASGPFVVGLTVLPPQPGEVEVRLQVLGVEAGDALRDARVRATSGERVVDLPLDACPQLGCFAGRGTLAAPGAWRFDVAVDSNRGPLEVSLPVPLPAEDALAELERVITSMQRLRAVRMGEVLRGSVGGEAVVSEYQYEAPDRFAFTLRDVVRITIGNRLFRREGRDRTWEVEETVAFRWPAGHYELLWGRPAAVRMLGREEVDGVESIVVAFVRPDLPAWFRLWVGVSDGLVRREEMFAEGHLMEHVYRDFNQGVDIAPPA